MFDRKEWHRIYDLERYHSFRKEAIVKLGGSCVHCGSTEQLEFDHIDPRSKKFKINTNVSLNNFWKEVDKCQLLCKQCHTVKTMEENGQLPIKGRHGTPTTYKHCKCNECKEAKSMEYKRYMKTLREKQIDL